MCLALLVDGLESGIEHLRRVLVQGFEDDRSGHVLLECHFLTSCHGHGEETTDTRTGLDERLHLHPIHFEGVSHSVTHSGDDGLGSVERGQHRRGDGLGHLFRGEVAEGGDAGDDIAHGLQQ